MNDLNSLLDRELPSVHQTNGDRIRSMTDEELAMIICCQDHKQGDECFDASCYDCTLDWLKQEVDDEHTY